MFPVNVKFEVFALAVICDPDIRKTPIIANIRKSCFLLGQYFQKEANIACLAFSGLDFRLINDTSKKNDRTLPALQKVPEFSGEL